MNTAEPLLIEPEVRHVGAKLLLAMLGVLWILLLLTGLRSDTNIAPDADALLFISCLYLLVLCWRVANTLAEAARCWASDAHRRSYGTHGAHLPCASQPAPGPCCALRRQSPRYCRPARITGRQQQRCCRLRSASG